MAASLGIDVGGTATRWVIADDAGAIVARGNAPGATGHLFNPMERDRFGAALSAVAESARGHAPSSIFLGITGLGESARADARAIVADAFPIDTSRIGLCDDMELAFRATFEPGAGHLVSAGTGSIGLHVTANGEIIRVGGRGHLIDDGGSGTWIALNALDQVYRRIDETGGPADAAILAAELYADIGGDQWEETRAFVYGGDRGRIGTLAQAVARAATKGDRIAVDILTRAAGEIAHLAKALASRVGPLPTAFVGGVVLLHPAIRLAIEAEFDAGIVTFPTIDPAAQAARMATANPVTNGSPG